MTDAMLFTLGQTASDQMMTGTAPVAAPAPGVTAPGTTAPAGQAAAPPGSGMMGMLIPFMLVMVVLIFYQQIMGQRREKKRRDTLMSSLKRGDRVLTIGGQLGIVDQVKDNEVVLKIDEHSNTKARFTKAAIQQILESGPGGDVVAVEVKASTEKYAAAR